MPEARGGFPGIAAFSLLGLAIALGAIALSGLRPWATSSLAPNLSLAPGIGIAVGDSAVVAEAEPSAHGTGGIAAPRSLPTVSAPVAVPTPEHEGTEQVLAVSAGRALTVAASALAASPPAPEPVPPAEPVAATPAPAPAAPPASPPVVASVPSGVPGTSGGPVTSGVGGLDPEPSCEGDEYLITVTFEEVEGEELNYEDADADIVVRQIDPDGNETEVQLRGNLSDVRDLIAALVAEGSCVHLEAGATASVPVPASGYRAAPNSP